MQARNEDLTTIEGGEPDDRVEARVDRANADFQTVLEASPIATVFLDERQRIRKDTQAASDVATLRGGDHGPP